MTRPEAVSPAIAPVAECPGDGVSFVKGKFDINPTNQVFNRPKSQLKEAAGGKTGRKSGRPAGTADGARSTQLGGTASAADPAELARTIRMPLRQQGPRPSSR